MNVKEQLHMVVMIACVSGGLLVAFMMAGAVTQAGWTAKPQVVHGNSVSKPNRNFDEARVPAYELPDPLRCSDGTVVTTAQQWPRRRAEILDLFREHVYGRSPDRPEHLVFHTVEEKRDAMDGAATLRRIAIECGHGPRRHTFELSIFVPNGRSSRAPLFLLINNRNPDNIDPTREIRSGFWPAEEVIARGYAVAVFDNAQLAPDHVDRWRDGIVRMFEGDMPIAERPCNAWGALSAWAWGASRAMDYLETDTGIDATKVAVLGHSRGGKAALWAGAQDTRFALAISNESGCGGAALSRRRLGESAAVMNRNFPHWCCRNFLGYDDREDQLPIDQHMLIAAIAPRAVYVASADEDLWADPRGEFLSLAHASPVYALWGLPPIDPAAMPPLEQPLIVDRRGYHIRSGKHDLTPYDWHRYMDFADRLWGH